jgi:hypothetical protein
MPPSKSRNLGLAKNLLGRKSESKSVQTEVISECKYIQTNLTGNVGIVTRSAVLEYVKSAGLTDKCEILKCLILSETQNLKASCDKSTLDPTSTICDISKLRPQVWLLNVHPMLKMIGESFSKVITPLTL